MSLAGKPHFRESRAGGATPFPVKPVQWMLAIVGLAVALLVGNSPAGYQLDNNIADALVRWFSPSPAPPSVSFLLAIDEQTLGRYGGMRGLRTILSRAAGVLAAHPPAVLAVDLTLADDGDPAEDQQLAAALRRLPAVVLAAEIRSSGDRWEVPAPVFAAAATSVGHVHAAPDPLDAVCREVPLEKAVDRHRYWALSLEAYRLWRETPYILETPGSLMVGSTEIPVTRDASRAMRIRFRRPENLEDGASVSRVSVADLLAHPERATGLEGKVVFLGITAQSAARDRLMTPFSFGRTMQGVEIHASAFETLASRRFLTPVRPFFALLLSVLLAGFTAVAFVFSTGWRTYGIAAFPVAAAVAIPPIAFLQDMLVPATGILLSAWLPFGALTAHRYWFVNRKLHRAERETENYRDAIHYVTHEMRTPLTAIQGSSEIITRYHLSEEKQKQIAGMIHSESKRLGRLIQVFLDVERLSAGEMQLKREEFSANLLIDNCATRVQPLASNKGISFTVDGTEAGGVVLTGDRELLEHALYNLLTNAVKYSPAGSTVALTCCKSGGDLVLRVADQGIGMTPEEVKSIFRKFYRTSAAEQSGEKGSGIGLSIVEQIVTEHNGRIDVSSKVGAGSVFSLILPCRVASVTSAEKP